MDKIFEKSKKTESRQNNRCKRPSAETADSASETKVEHVKRPKLSASLQGDDDVVVSQHADTLKQPARRPLNSSSRDQTAPSQTPVDEKSETPIPVKKFISPPSGGRETRSKARRGPVSLIRFVESTVLHPFSSC